jgi:hypothetical protein
MTVDRKFERGNVNFLWNDRPVPTYEELVVGRKHAAIEDFEGRFQKRGPPALQDHLPLLRESARQFAPDRLARQIEIDKIVGPTRRSRRHCGKCTCRMEKMAAAD